MEGVVFLKGFILSALIKPVQYRWLRIWHSDDWVIFIFHLYLLWYIICEKWENWNICRKNRKAMLTYIDITDITMGILLPKVTWCNHIYIHILPYRIIYTYTCYKHCDNGYTVHSFRTRINDLNVDQQFSNHGIHKWLNQCKSKSGREPYTVYYFLAVFDWFTDIHLGQRWFR